MRAAVLGQIQNPAMRFRTRRVLLALILVAAYLLRLWLIQSEGQRHFSDEFRYDRGMKVARHLYDGEHEAAWRLLFRYIDHPGFTLLGTVPAYIDRLVWEIAPKSDLSWWDYWKSKYGDYRLSAAMFALPSVLSILLIYLIAREKGAGGLEALLAAFLLAASNAWYMYSQYFLPYDFSLMFSLVALWLALRCRAGPVWLGTAIGLLAGFAFWVYSGYFSVLLLLAVVFCLILAGSLKEAVLRMAGMSVGLLGVIAPHVYYSAAVSRQDFLGMLGAFAGTVNQGEFGEGFSVPIMYFMHAETGMALVWLLGVGLALWRIRKVKCGEERRRLALWLFCALFLYAIMVLQSNVLQRAVVYGRTARVMTPFVALICAGAFTPYFRKMPKPTKLLVLLGLAGLALLNFVPMARREHYRVITRDVYASYADVSSESTFGEAKAYGIHKEPVEGARFKLLNAAIYYPIESITPLPAGRIAREYEHHATIRAWQYEGMSPHTRDLVNGSPLKIWLIDTWGDSD